MTTLTAKMKKGKYNKKRLEEVQRVLSNPKDPGKFGKVFELLVRCLLTPNSKITKVQKAGGTDIRFQLKDKGGKVTTYYTEVKSLSGEIIKLEDEELYSAKVDSLTLDHLLSGQKSPYILYSLTGKLEDAYLMKTEEFFKLLREYPSRTGNPNGMFQRMGSIKKAKEKGYMRYKLAVHPSNCKAKNDWLGSKMGTIGISLKDLLEARA